MDLPNSNNVETMGPPQHVRKYVGMYMQWDTAFLFAISTSEVIKLFNISFGCSVPGDKP